MSRVQEPDSAKRNLLSRHRSPRPRDEVFGVIGEAAEEVTQYIVPFCREGREIDFKMNPGGSERGRRKPRRLKKMHRMPQIAAR